MTWFFENPWPSILGCAALAAVFVFLWSGRKRAVYLAAAAGMLLLALGAVIVERTIVTDSERVEQSIYGLARAFQRKEVPVVLGYFSPQAPELQNMVRDAAERITVRDDLRISDVEVALHSQNSRAITKFRASGTVAFNDLGVGYQPSRWEVTWQQEGGAWKIIKLERVDIMSGKKVDFYSSTK